MQHTHQTPRPLFNDSATYKIVVLGRLGTTWSDRLGGINITHHSGPDGLIETVLVGRMADQAALSGVLNTLYDLHLPVLTVNCLDCENRTLLNNSRFG